MKADCRDDSRAAGTRDGGSGPVLVTGGAGFIGSHLCERLVRDGHTVVAVDDLGLGREANLASIADHERFVFERLDVARDSTRLAELFGDWRFASVWHLAANSDIQLGSGDRSVDLDRTFLTTFATLERAGAGDVREFFFASTSAVFGDTDRPLDESSGPVEPISFYGAAKLASEAYVSAYAHRAGFDAWIFRFPNVVGRRATHGVILDFVRRVRATGCLEVLGDGTQTKPYLHVDDLIEGMLLARGHRAGRINVFHLAGKGLTSVRDIARWVAQAMDLPFGRVTFGDGNRGWPGDVPRFEYDCSKITALGWIPGLASDAAVRRAIAEVVAQEAVCSARL